MSIYFGQKRLTLKTSWVYEHQTKRAGPYDTDDNIRLNVIKSSKT